ncbi:hypothetical protein PHET_07590 [Paragonimus heterotremus]|uniref:Uncharacterized protein n=1 Tax=Paragonimus heterotremus TaxID=100268 RepID=A0A8J4WFJ4_9TREM|nr:hypothetical protein PHET_07590 [Paragonimus heterotremus]
MIIRRGLCDLIAESAPNAVEACCLERVSHHRVDDLPIAEYRILYKQEEKFEEGIARSNLQNALDVAGSQDFGCIRNAYWID